MVGYKIVMSLQCPKCNGVVYDRRNSKCGFCGAELPAEFRFTDAEAAAVAEQIKVKTEVCVPRFPTASIIIWLLVAVGWGYLASNHQRWSYWYLPWIEWLCAGSALGSAVGSLVRFVKQKRRYESQRHAA